MYSFQGNLCPFPKPEFCPWTGEEIQRSVICPQALCASNGTGPNSYCSNTHISRAAMVCCETNHTVTRISIFNRINFKTNCFKWICLFKWPTTHSDNRSGCLTSQISRYINSEKNPEKKQLKVTNTVYVANMQLQLIIMWLIMQFW